MPLSFRRSYRRLPSAHFDPDKRGIIRTPGKQTAAEAPAEFRPLRYPAIIPTGCGLGLGFCLFLAISQGLVRLPSVALATLGERAAIYTPANGATPAAEVSAGGVGPTTQTPKFEPAPTSMPFPTATSLPVNAWVGDIPEAACIPADLPQTGRVVETLDGDTIKVLLDSDGRVYSVRYLGVAAPGLTGASPALGREAAARNSALVYRKQALLVRDLTNADANGTLLRYVLADGVFVNHALIQSGLAQVEMAAPDTACLESLMEAQRQAQARGLGLWAGAPEATPTP